jgi:hypothetical protein
MPLLIANPVYVGNRARKEVATALLRRAVLIEVLTEADSDGAGESVRKRR